MTPQDILSIQRIVGFIDNIEKLKITDIMVRIMERAGKRQDAEVETLKTLANEFKSRGYSLQDAFAHLDTNESGTITSAEFRDALRAMKIEIGKQTLMNVLHLFDTNGDNAIQLEEFERKMSKYLGGAATGRIQPLTSADQIKSKIIPDAMKEELVKEMQAEQKKKVDFQDFSIKEISAAEAKRKEQALIDAIKKGQVAPEMINGELKLQIEEGLGLITVPGKPVPYIGLNIINYTAEGVKSE